MGDAGGRLGAVGGIVRSHILRQKLFGNRSHEIGRLETETADRQVLEPSAARRKAPGKEPALQVLDQWVEVEITPEGKAVTTLYPANELLLESAAKLNPNRDLVYRRFHFVHGVPGEYAWTTNDEGIRANGGMGIQRMTAATWLEQIEREKDQGAGHLLPCGGNVPRPEERGGCECEVCEENREIFDSKA